MYVFEDFAQSLGDLRLAKARRLAFPAIAATAVINVFPFLPLCRDGAIVVCAGHKSTKCKLLPTVFRFVVAAQHSLHPLIQIQANKRGMCAVIHSAGPDEVPFIKRVCESRMQMGP